MATESKELGPRETEAHEYMEKHRILELFNNLTTQLIYNRPDDPKKFTIEVLERLMNARTAHREYPCVFDDSNITSLFGMLDPTQTGYVSYQQYAEAMTTLGVKNYDEEPDGKDIDRIQYDVFMAEARKGLIQASATFAVPSQ
ncbi:EF-hand calcium-binding domain-containing protein 10-like [Gigantopelta aegis]|uniref:EF-hand calcium-binding domain-containing protein 10-like n=1 Tax=Gigantopelta aegis TaxID=1735272 RepID=UPI001B88B669|nr:EF-hand calcium-binding domain-containing protein 10-like [Gigantopelta aegis]